MWGGRCVRVGVADEGSEREQPRVIDAAVVASVGRDADVDRERRDHRAEE